MGELEGIAVGVRLSNVKWGQRRQISQGAAIKSWEFGFNLKCNRKLYEDTQGGSGMISFVFNKVFPANRERSCRRTGKQVGRPTRNTCTKVHRKVTLAWTRAGLEETETTIGMEEREANGRMLCKTVSEICYVRMRRWEKERNQTN